MVRGQGLLQTPSYRKGGADPVVATPVEATKPVTPPPTDSGWVEIRFKDDELASKIELERKDDRAEVERANTLVQRAEVNGVVYSEKTDSENDKTIYQGPVKILKNTITLLPMKFKRPIGDHRLIVSISNIGRDSHADKFTELIDLDLVIPVYVTEGRPAVVRVGINRGRFRLGKPRLYQAGN